jgi:anti-sigma B factor antagonist
MAADKIPELHVETERLEKVTFVRCAGQVDLDTWNQFSAKIRALIPEGKPIRVDLADVTRVDSTGIGALVGIWTAAKRRNCDLKYINPSRRIEDVIRISALLGMLEGHEAEERQLSAALSVA